MLLRLFTANSSPELEGTAHPASSLKCPSKGCQKDAFQSEVRELELEEGRPVLSCWASVQLALFSPSANVQGIFASLPHTEHYPSPRKRWCPFDKESTKVPSYPAPPHIDRAAGLWLTCSRALKTCSTLANSSLPCFIERWVWVKDRYWLAGRVSRQSLGVQSRTLSHALPHKSTTAWNWPGLCSLLWLQISCKHDLLFLLLCLLAPLPAPLTQKIWNISFSSDVHQCNLLYLT